MSRTRKTNLVNYAKNPSWWNRIFNNRPKKREAHKLEREASKGADLDSMMWPADKKPNKYYW